MLVRLVNDGRAIALWAAKKCRGIVGFDPEAAATPFGPFEEGSRPIGALYDGVGLAVCAAPFFGRYLPDMAFFPPSVVFWVKEVVGTYIRGRTEKAKEVDGPVARH